jgi:RNA polymerase sigma-70 factor (ECF subfamily)
MSMTVEMLLAVASLPDAEVVERVRRGETALFEILMRRHNQRVYRVARAVVRDETEAEDVMQQAYINAFVHLDQFEDRAQFSTWLTRIAVHEALSRRRRADAQGARAAGTVDEVGDAAGGVESGQPDPERLAYSGELGRVLEEAIDGLPEPYRMVFMLREIEELNTSETSAALDLSDEAVKTRLHRARGMVRRALTARLGTVTADTFRFHLSRCDRVVTAVLTAIGRRGLGTR